jgi:hypothetical protein
MAFWGSCSINMALLTKLSQSLIPLKTAKNQLLGSLLRLVGRPSSFKPHKDTLRASWEPHGSLAVTSP